MELECQICNFNFANYPAKLDLGATYHSIFCPVCGERIIDRVEFTGVFYDDQERAYIVWNPKSQRTNGNITEMQKIGSLELSITGNSLNPYDICFKKVAVFQHENEIILPHHIVEPKYHHYLNPNARITGRLESNRVEYQLPLRGKFTAQIRLPALLSKSEISQQTGKFSKTTALNLWPNFRRIGWNNYFFYFASNDPNVNLEFLRVIGADNRHETFEGRTARGEVNFIPELVVIKLTDITGTEFWSCYRVEFREDLAPANGEREEQIPILSLDFGTSNTCFAVKLSQVTPVEVIHFRERTFKIIKGFSVEDTINLPWFPEIGGDLEFPTQLPSELSFYKETEKIANEISGLQPIVHFTIPPFTRYREDEEKMILGKLKWENALPPTLSALVYDLQHLYLSLAYRMALAELASDPRCQRLDRIDLIATCPLAFDEKQRTGFRRTISRVQHTILEKTGVNLILQKMYDESHAGEAGSGQMQGTDETIYIDVGGGTTDIGFFQFEIQDNQSIEKPIFLDSFQYAGDDVWVALADNNLSSWKPTKFAREARAKGAAEIFHDPHFAAFDKQRNNADRGQEAIKNFFDGLIEYTARMIAAREHNRPGGNENSEISLGLYLLGNGWRFLEVFHQIEGRSDIGSVIEQSVKSLVEQRLNRYNINVPPITVIYPFLTDKDPKTVVALGAAALYVGERAGGVVPEPSFTLQSFLGSDLKIYAPEHLIGWYEKIPYALSPSTNIKGINFIGPKEFSFERKIVDGDRIEQNNLLLSDTVILTGTRGTRYINKNMFAFYLENWHKFLLVS